ncbi:MAG: 3-hydroxyacyl-CoA dehydrogenase NAD-binding domain-containing protein [Planctomycetota bacterium]|jgi:enoyl-CoA hydratase/3-hydroxyacyl-CoA dehydrogenase|nr:3-hydroxyacyl-CoA dehydrogenase NAD-binding domain-containing protein [Planctomycetota bacterium]
MTLSISDQSIRCVGIIGSGNIGPDIALHFSKVLSPYGTRIIMVDIVQEALDSGKAKMEKKIGKGVESGAFKPKQAETMIEAVSWTTDLSDLGSANLVIEAASEDLGLKQKIFGDLEEIVSEKTIFASNSSHLEPERIFAKLTHPRRSMVVHYFFPAERNPLVEVVPSNMTDPELTRSILHFYEDIGKVPLQIGSRYGYAVDPIFEGIFQAALLAVEEGLGDHKQVDHVATQTLGLGVGPFTAMNLTGGTPLTFQGLQGYHEKIMPWYQPPRSMAQQIETGQPWPAAGRSEVIDIDDQARQAIGNDLLGAFFGMACEVIDSGITNLSDLELAIELGLVMQGPFSLMNQVGIQRSLELVENYARKHDGFTVSESLRKQAASGSPWEIGVVFREDHGDVAVVTIRRPKVLNALNPQVMHQMHTIFEEIAADDSISGAVLTGYGRKAFVSGADITVLATFSGPEGPSKAEELSCRDQGIIDFIEDLQKPVVCAYNGLAFGGGNELAMGCHARIASKGMRILAGQPEPNLGIIPGAGGTQRLPRLIGMEPAWKMLRDAKPISSSIALEFGLILEEVEGDLIESAIDIVRQCASGERTLTPIPREPISVPESLPDIDIGHLSQKIDEILQATILEGAAMSLRDGLALEQKRFGECFKTQDGQIGLSNFIENGPRVPAKFTHA